MTSRTLQGGRGSDSHVHPAVDVQKKNMIGRQHHWTHVMIDIVI